MWYTELRQIAARHLRRERPDTLQLMELAGQGFTNCIMRPVTPPQWADRSHFFAVASTATRRVLEVLDIAPVAGLRQSGTAA